MRVDAAGVCFARFAAVVAFLAPGSASALFLSLFTSFLAAFRLAVSAFVGRPFPRLGIGLICGASVDGPVLADSSRDAACGRRDARDDTSTFNAPSMSSYMSMFSTAADFAEVPLDAPLAERPLRAGTAVFSTLDAALPLVIDADFFASLPETFLVGGFAAALDSMHFGLSSFLRLEDRGESSMWAMEWVGFGVARSR